jgi:hypothetical protein
MERQILEQGWTTQTGEYRPHINVGLLSHSFRAKKVGNQETRQGQEKFPLKGIRGRTRGALSCKLGKGKTAEITRRPWSA